MLVRLVCGSVDLLIWVFFLCSSLFLVVVLVKSLGHCGGLWICEVASAALSSPWVCIKNSNLDVTVPSSLANTTAPPNMPRTTSIRVVLLPISASAVPKCISATAERVASTAADIWTFVHLTAVPVKIGMLQPKSGSFSNKPWLVTSEGQNLTVEVLCSWKIKSFILPAPELSQCDIWPSYFQKQE